MDKTSDFYLTDDEEQILLRIARDSLAAWATRGKRPPLEGYALTETLCEKRGAFVTLRRGKELRGCIGYTKSIEPLCETVRDNTINAAARDPRFPPITEDELDDIQIEVSALRSGDTPDSPFIAVQNTDEIVIGRDGLYLDHAGPRGGGLLLPQVAVEQGWDTGQFLEAVCKKAGAESRAWESPGNKLFRFSAQVFHESAAGGTA